MRYLWHLTRPDGGYDEAYEILVAAERVAEAKAFAQLSGDAPEGAWHEPTVKVARIGVAARGMNGVLMKAVRFG